MEYIKRDLERKFLNMSSVFKAVMAVDARQVGKSTILRRPADRQGRQWVAMDDRQTRNLARSDPKLFFQTFKAPDLD